MKLYYLTPLSFPSNYANRLQVVKMSEAFSEISDFFLYIREASEGKEKIFSDYNIKPFNIKEVSSKNLWPRSFWYALFLKKEVERSDDDTIFYCRDLLLSAWLAYLSPKFRKNFFFENHSLGKFPDFLYQTVFKNAKGIISTNIKKADDIVEKYGISKNKIAVFGNGVDLREFDSLPDKESLKKELGLSTSKTIVLYAGTYTKEYGKEIIEELKNRMSEMEFIVCTNKPRNIALKYMKASDILLAPYSAKNERIRLYSSPVKIKEYLASGTPMVVSDIPAAREIIGEGEGYFAEPDNAGDFMAEIRKILDNPEEGKRRAEKVKEKAGDYSWQKRAETILKFIKDKF